MLDSYESPFANENERRFPGNKIHATAVFGPNVTMGTGNEIGPYCIVGFPGEHRGRWGKDLGVLIGNNNIFTGHVTIDSGIEHPTHIHNWTFIMKHAHIGHDADVMWDVTIACGAKIGGHAIIYPYANIGLNAVVHQKHQVHNHCMIAMGAVVTLKCLTRPGYMYAGNPAVEKGQNKKAPHLFADGNKPGGYQPDRFNPNRHEYNSLSFDNTHIPAENEGPVTTTLQHFKFRRFSWNSQLMHGKEWFWGYRHLQLTGIGFSSCDATLIIEGCKIIGLQFVERLINKVAIPRDIINYLRVSKSLRN